MKKKKKRFRSLILELDEERKRLGFSINHLCVFFPEERNSRQFFRWIYFQASPTRHSATLVRKAIAEMKKIPTPQRDPLFASRDRYRAIREFLTIEEKLALLDLSGEEYEKRLRELSEKYQGQKQATE